jgi:hypothetical protein
MQVDDLGDMDVAQPATLDKDKHIDALEDKVDELEKLVRKLRGALASRPDHIDYKERYEEILANYNKLLAENLPF